MTERMLLEALIEHHGIAEILKLIEMVCDAKAAEMSAYGQMTMAKTWAGYAEKLALCARV